MLYYKYFLSLLKFTLNQFYYLLHVHTRPCTTVHKVICNLCKLQYITCWPRLCLSTYHNVLVICNQKHGRKKETRKTSKSSQSIHLVSEQSWPTCVLRAFGQVEGKHCQSLLKHIMVSSIKMASFPGPQYLSVYPLQCDQSTTGQRKTNHKSYFNKTLDFQEE